MGAQSTCTCTCSLQTRYIQVCKGAATSYFETFRDIPKCFILVIQELTSKNTLCPAVTGPQLITYMQHVPLLPPVHRDCVALSDVALSDSYLPNPKSLLLHICIAPAQKTKGFQLLRNDSEYAATGCGRYDFEIQQTVLMNPPPPYRRRRASAIYSSVHVHNRATQFGSCSPYL